MQIVIRIVFYTLVIFGTFFLCSSCANASVPHDEEYLYAMPLEMYSLRTQWGRPQDQITQKDTRDQRKKWQEAHDFHVENGVRCYLDAKEKCWWLPEVGDREKARYCFMTAISAVGNATPHYKLVAMVTQLALQYGLDCMSEWEYIQTKLHWSIYHFEMCDHYDALLKKA